MPFVIAFVIAFVIVFNRHRYRERVDFDSTLPSAVTYNLEIQIVQYKIFSGYFRPKKLWIVQKDKVEY